MSPGDFESVLAEHVASSYSSAIHARLRASLAGIESRGRKRVYRNVVSASGRLNSKAVLGLLASWAFNYNSVEQVCLASSILVCLLGIMYESSQLTPDIFASSQVRVSFQLKRAPVDASSNVECCIFSSINRSTYISHFNYLHLSRTLSLASYSSS